METLLDNNEGKEKEEKEKKGGMFERIGESFLQKRQIFLWGQVSDKSMQPLIEKMLFLENEDPGKPIYFFINSPGGVISSGMALYDVMKMITSPVYTIAMGMAASMGAVLLAAGEKGHRYVFQHAKVLIHQPLISGQIVAPALDIKIHAEEIKKTRVELNTILSEASGQSIEKIEADTDRDYYLAGQEAVDYGIVDKLLTDIAELDQPAKVAPKAKTAAKSTTATKARKTSTAKKSEE